MPAPAHRPPLALRAFAALVGVSALLFNVLLMLSDRAPGRCAGSAATSCAACSTASTPATAPPTCSPIRGCPRATPSSTSPSGRSPSALVGLAVWTWIGLLDRRRRRVRRQHRGRGGPGPLVGHAGRRGQRRAGQRHRRAARHGRRRRCATSPTAPSPGCSASRRAAATRQLEPDDRQHSAVWGRSYHPVIWAGGRRLTRTSRSTALAG